MNKLLKISFLIATSLFVCSEALAYVEFTKLPDATTVFSNIDSPADATNSANIGQSNQNSQKQSTLNVQSTVVPFTLPPAGDVPKKKDKKPKPKQDSTQSANKKSDTQQSDTDDDSDTQQNIFKSAPVTNSDTNNIYR